VLSLVLLGCPPKQPVATDLPDAAAAASAETPPEQLVAEPEPLTEDEIHQQVNEAVSWLTTGQPELARQALERLTQLSAEAPELAEIPYNQGVAYQILGDNEMARKRYLRASDIDPTLGAAWLNLGAIAEREGDLSRALQAYRAGLRDAPDDPDLVVGLIGALRKMGRSEQAITEAKEALARNANNINVYNNLGLVYIEQGNLELAQFVYQKALNDIPGAEQNALIHANLGQVFLLKDKAANAKLELEKALELDPTLVTAQMYLAQLHMENRDWTATVSVLEQARQQEPSNPAIHINLGIGYRGLKRFDDAQQSYQKALELDPTNPDPYLNLAVLLGDHMQKYSEALDFIDTYRDEGGSRTELVDEWETALKKAKKRYDREQQRRQRREESRQREDLAREAEEADARAAEEAARLAEQQAASQPPPMEAEGGDADQGASGEAEPSQGASGEAGVPQSPQDTTGGASPWGDSDSGQRSASADDILRAAEAGGTVGAGMSCSVIGQCGSPDLECASDGICRDAGSLGTLLMGMSCSAVTDCAFGLTCVSGACLDEALPASAPPAEDASESTQTDDNPWGQ
jgi:tetratricopeptide (TPR) repeat protein